MGMLLHTFVDFNLHIFSNALLFLLQTFLASAPGVSSAASYSSGAAPVRFSR
jgi:hypothetical protein